MADSEIDPVEAYLIAAPPAQRADLRRLRDLARGVLRDHEERIHWGAPAYLREGRMRFGFAARKQFLAVYFFAPGAFDPELAATAGGTAGKHSLRFRKTASINWLVIHRLLEATSRRPG